MSDPDRSAGEASPPARVGADPMSTLREILERSERRLEARRTELTEARQALSQLGSRGDGGHEVFCDPVSPDLVLPLVRRLAEEHAVVRTSVTALDLAALGKDEHAAALEELLAGRRVRHSGLYPMSLQECAAGRTVMRMWATLRQDRRLSPAPPGDFAVFGDSVVMAAARWGDSSVGSVLVRDPMLVRAFIELFDRCFAAALPVPVLSDGSDVDRRLLDLLAAGLKDESIARYLGCSLRTVRRRIARLMELHGAQTRFQLGMAAARDDLVARPRATDR